MEKAIDNVLINNLPQNLTRALMDGINDGRVVDLIDVILVLDD